MWVTKDIRLSPRSEGIYLIENEIISALPEIKNVKVGLLHLFVKHTSAGICLNENYDPDVRVDMNNVFKKLVPENDTYLHADEGPDDMPSHVKTVLAGNEVTIPIKNGSLNVGTWQGIYLCEFRRYRHSRTIVATINGE